MKVNKKRLFTLLVCMFAFFALGIFAACTPEEPEEQSKTLAKALDRLELNTDAVKKQFTVGEAFTHEGLKVTAFYSDETSSAVTGYTVTPNNLENGKLTATSDKVTVSYTEESVTKTAFYSIVVTEAQDDAPKVTGISVSKLPDTTEYFVGEIFSAEGLALEVTYDNGDSQTVTTGFNASASTMMAGEINVTVTYAGKSASFSITVYNKLTDLAIEGQSMYYLGEAFGGVTVTALYNGKTTGGTVLDEEDYELEISPALNEGKFDTEGQYTVTVSYSEEKIEGRQFSANKTFDVSVIDASGSVDIPWGEEGNSMREWKYWTDPNTNIITVGEVRLFEGDEDVSIHAAFTSSGELDYGFQLFYNDTDAYDLGSPYLLTLTVTSKTDCSVVINGQKYNLTANEPKTVEVSFGYSYNGDYTGMSLFDMQVIVEAGAEYDLMLTGIKWKAEEVGGEIPETYALVYSTEQNYIANATLLGRWVYYHNAEENGAELGSKANGQYNNGTVTFNFTENVGSWWCTQLFYKNPDFAVGSNHSVKLTLLSDFDGSITVNGHVYALANGVAQTVEFNFTQSANATIGIQLGVESDNSAAAEAGKLTISDIIFGEEKDPVPGSGGQPGGGGNLPGGEDYVVELTKTEVYNNMFVKLYMSAEDFNLLKGAAKVVVNSTYTGTNWKGGFLVDGTVCIQVKLAEVSAEAGEYVLSWYDSDNNLIATCSFTI